jgi:hypothetical protein
VIVVGHHISAEVEADFNSGVFEGDVGWEGRCGRLHIAEQVTATCIDSATSKNVVAAEWVCLLLLRVHAAAKEIAHWIHGIRLLWWSTKSHSHQVIGVLLGHTHAHVKQSSATAHGLVLISWTTTNQIKEA